MSDNKQNARSQDYDIEYWARTLGITSGRLKALVKEVVNERQADLSKAHRK
jgi:hypothetical protein